MSCGVRVAHDLWKGYDASITVGSLEASMLDPAATILRCCGIKEERC